MIEELVYDNPGLKEYNLENMKLQIDQVVYYE